MNQLLHLAIDTAYHKMSNIEDALPFAFLSKLSLTQHVYNVGQASGSSLHSLVDFVQTSRAISASSIPKLLNDIDWCCLPDILNPVNLFKKYGTWWWNLLQRDPIHVLIETVLLGFLAYLVIYRNKVETRKRVKDRLTDTEIQELLKEWKDHRVGLVPNSTASDSLTPSDGTSVESYPSGKTTKDTIVINSMKGSKVTFHYKNDKSVTKTAINFTTHDYLGLSCPDPPSSSQSSTPEPNTTHVVHDNDVLQKASISALNYYGCGSCGPRGFYGTLDAHLSLEDHMAKLTGTDDAILYSDGSAACASTVAAFAKRGDLIVCDEGCYEALGTGVELSRATVKYFKHNDMDDLRRVLERVQATDIQLGRNGNDQRRFIVVEALYTHHGTICPLPDLIKLKNEFCYRLILDESHSFGALGPTGLGLLEHFGLSFMKDAEIVTIGLEQAIGSIGGITVGNEEVVDHQRLSGAGYCFSASLPPFLADAARASLTKMKEEPELVKSLQEKIQFFYDRLDKEMGTSGKESTRMLKDLIKVVSAPKISPIVVIQLSHLRKETEFHREDQIKIMDAIASKCLEKGILLVSTGSHVYHHLHKLPPASLRLTIMAKQSEKDIELAILVLKEVIFDHLG